MQSKIQKNISSISCYPFGTTVYLCLECSTVWRQGCQAEAKERSIFSAVNEIHQPTVTHSDMHSWKWPAIYCSLYVCIHHVWCDAGIDPIKLEWNEAVCVDAILVELHGVHACMHTCIHTYHTYIYIWTVVEHACFLSISIAFYRRANSWFIHEM